MSSGTAHRSKYQLMLVLSCLWFLGGVWLAGLLLTRQALPPLLWTWAIWSGFSTILLGLILSVVGTTRQQLRSGVLLVCFCWGGLYTTLHQTWGVAPHQQRFTQLRTYLTTQARVLEPGPDPQQWKVVIEPRANLRQDNNTSDRYTVMARFRALPPLPDLAIGDRLSLTGSIKGPHRPWYPGGFDEQTYFRQQGVDGTLTVDRWAQRPKQPWEIDDIGYGLLNTAHQLRHRLMRQFHRALPPDAAQLLGSVVIGERAVHMDRETKQWFIQSGLVHLLAASGLNVGLIALFFLGLGALCRLPQPWSLGVALVGVGFYSLMTGLPPPIQRASSMFALAVCFKWARRDLRPFSLLCLSGTLLTLLNPYLLQTLSFQLSFLSTMGLLAMVKPFQPRLGFYLTHRLAGWLLVPAIAQLWVFPLIWLTFGQIQTASILANLEALPLAMLMTWVGFVLGGLSLVIPNWALPVLSWLAWLPQALQSSAYWFAHQDWSSVRLPPPPAIWVVLVYLGLITWAVRLAFPFPTAQPHQKRWAVGLGLLLLCLPIPLHRWVHHPPTLSLIPHRYGDRSLVLHQPFTVVISDKLTPSIAKDIQRYFLHTVSGPIGLLVVNHATPTTPKALEILRQQTPVETVATLNRYTTGQWAWESQDAPFTLRHWQTPTLTVQRLEWTSTAPSLNRPAQHHCLLVINSPFKLDNSPLWPLTQGCPVAWLKDTHQWAALQPHNAPPLNRENIHTLSGYTALFTDSPTRWRRSSP